MYEKTRDILYPNPAVRVKQVSDKGIASIGVSVIQNFDKMKICILEHYQWEFSFETLLHTAPPFLEHLKLI